MTRSFFEIFQNGTKNFQEVLSANLYPVKVEKRGLMTDVLLPVKNKRAVTGTFENGDVELLGVVDKRYTLMGPQYLKRLYDKIVDLGFENKLCLRTRSTFEFAFERENSVNADNSAHNEVLYVINSFDGRHAFRVNYLAVRLTCMNLIPKLRVSPYLFRETHIGDETSIEKKFSDFLDLMPTYLSCSKDDYFTVMDELHATPVEKKEFLKVIEDSKLPKTVKENIFDFSEYNYEPSAWGALQILTYVFSRTIDYSRRNKFKTVRSYLEGYRYLQFVLIMRKLLEKHNKRLI